MKAHEKTKEQLIRELKDLRKQLADQIKAKNRRKGNGRDASAAPAAE